jgi:hypothetical protein
VVADAHDCIARSTGGTSAARIAVPARGAIAGPDLAPMQFEAAAGAAIQKCFRRPGTSKIPPVTTMTL